MSNDREVRATERLAKAVETLNSNINKLTMALVSANSQVPDTPATPALGSEFLEAERERMRIKFSEMDKREEEADGS